MTSVEDRQIVQEMSESFLQYSMSVITSRAIPDVRDGLKPVQRRIVYAMNDMGCVAGTAFKKSARIEGECLGKYHPHGGVYGAMVNMAQTFGMEEVLVDGQGNFGSIDGDPPAAMRYTEARLSKLAMEMIADIDMDTIDWRPNYDGSLQEPVVLPSRFPNLLVNGSQGIAVGMATSIPSHNLTECMNALLALADNAELTNADIIRDYIPAPDFPTGGLVYGRDDIDRAYHTGRGRCLIRSKYHIEKTKGDKREQIVFTEIPYQVNKASEISKIADLVRDKKIEGISDIRDESDKDGIRIVVVLKKDESPDLIVNQILQSTELQKSFPITFLAIVNGQPRVMNLKEMLLEFLYFRQEVVTRRTTFLLNKANDRLHVLKALELALSKLDATIKTIRAAGNPSEAKIALQDLLSIDEKQASAILALTLQRLTGLERQKIVDEIAALGVEVATYEDILANYTSLMAVIKSEFNEILTKYGKPRNSELSIEMAKISKEDVIADEEVIISFSRDGYIKRTPADTYKRQKRGGKGKVGMGTKSEDVVDQLFSASNHENLLIFTNKGNVYTVKVYDIPEAGATGKGRAIANLIDLKKDEEIETFFTARTFPQDEYLLFFTRNGIVKKTSMDNYATVRSNGLIAVNLEEGDSLIAVKRTNGNKQVVIATGLGKAIRFNEKDIRSVGRSAIGVGGIKLLSNDFVVDAEVIDPVTEIAEGEEADTNVDKQQGVFLTITEKGYGVRTSIQEYRLQGRNGGGIINTRTGPKNGLVCGFNLINENEEVIVMTEGGMTIRFDPQEVRKAQRGSMGVQVTKLKAGDRIVGIVKVSKEEAEVEDDTLVTENV